ncbi:MAG: NAD(+)/NADH kinase [Coriobacteriia bacterium]|nr:NAD(+)/NADH kinase [Coriobacteriia bacterium]
MKVLIIDNLVSGLKTRAVYDFCRIFAQDGDELTIRSTDGTTMIEDMLDDATGYDLVVAAGGDATISAVAYELRNSAVPLLPFPAGSANLLATNLGTPEEPSALARIARTLKTEKYDLGELEFICSKKLYTKGFAVIAGAGYDATIVGRAERLKEFFGPMAYFAAAISEPNPKVASFTLTLDNEVLSIEGIAVLIVNFAQIYPDLSIVHGNDAKDGLFEVVVIKKQHAVELLPALFSAVLDAMGNFPARADALEVRFSSQVKVESDPPMEIQIDGDVPSATTPFHAKNLPGAARFVVA